jgi:polyisoprenoid-binding protein YceI
MKNWLIAALLALSVTGVFSCKKESEAAPATEAVETKPVAPQSEKFTVDTTASVITWTGAKPTGQHTGIIRLSGGEVFVKNDSIETGKFVINMKSITVTDVTDAQEKKSLEDHLKGVKKGAEDHFFNTHKYPAGNFEITGLTTENGIPILQGNLTLKDITKNIQFPATVNVDGNKVTINSESFKINRILWKINFSSKSVFENLGNNYINDDIEVKFSVVATKQ